MAKTLELQTSAAVKDIARFQPNYDQRIVEIPASQQFNKSMSRILGARRPRMPTAYGLCDDFRIAERYTDHPNLVKNHIQRRKEEKYVLEAIKVSSN